MSLVYDFTADPQVGGCLYRVYKGDDCQRTNGLPKPGAVPVQTGTTPPTREPHSTIAFSLSLPGEESGYVMVWSPVEWAAEGIQQ